MIKNLIHLKNITKTSPPVLNQGARLSRVTTLIYHYFATMVSVSDKHHFATVTDAIPVWPKHQILLQPYSSGAIFSKIIRTGFHRSRLSFYEYFMLTLPVTAFMF
jgi:hypothetical protein